jgi:hypothetical protein
MHTSKGTYEIAKAIYDGLKGNARLTKEHERIIRSILDGIDEGIQEEYTKKEKKADMNKDMKTIALSRGMTDAEVRFFDRTCKAFGFTMMQLDEVSISSYRWIMEKESTGQTIEAFAEWARLDDMGKFIGKYRKNGGNIKNDWARAFGGNSGNEVLSTMVRL